jgi:hypothetical protein
MRLASLFRSVCLLASLAVSSPAHAQERPVPPEPARGHPAAVPLLTAAGISGFLGTVALYIAFSHSDDASDISDDPLRMAMATTAGMCGGTGLVLLSAGIPALLATPATGQQSSALSPAPPARALVLGYRFDF